MLPDQPSIVDLCLSLERLQRTADQTQAEIGEIRQGIAQLTGAPAAATITPKFAAGLAGVDVTVIRKRAKTSSWARRSGPRGRILIDAPAFMAALRKGEK